MSGEGAVISLRLGSRRCRRSVARSGALVAIMLACGTAAAQPIEIASIKCKAFMELPKETANAVTVWLDGHLTDEEEVAVVDLDRLKAMTQKLVAFCAQNPAMGLISAAENILTK
jgi:acid stress chaperone HdeB